MIDVSQLTDARRALGRQLARYRRAAGYSQHELAPLVLYGRSTIANVEVGRQNVPKAFWQSCDELLTADGVLLQGFDQLQALISRERRQAARLEAQRAPYVAGAAGSLGAGSWAADNLGYASRYPGRVDLVAVAQLRERVQITTEAYDVVPSVSLLAAAGQCQAQVIGLREHASDGRVRRALYAVEAEVSTLMGQLVWDASQRRDHATTLAHFDHAIAAAQQIDHAVAEAHATLRKSYVALYGVRQAETGLALASQAAHVSQGRSHTLTGLALLHVAEAHGMLGDRHGCERALGAAETHFAQRGSLDPALDYYSPAHFGRLAGSCYLSLALPVKAEAFLARTARAMLAWQKVSALVLGNLTLAYIRQRKIDEATASLHDAIDVVERTRGGGGLNVIFAAGRELRPWRQDQAVQSVHDRLLALMA